MGKRGLGLIEEHMDEGPRPKTHLVITEKGRKVAELIKRIQTVLEH
jgi:DNA-binding MarR family transcriptional regulator